MAKEKCFLFLVLCAVWFGGKAQTVILSSDSLEAMLRRNPQHDSNRVNLLNQLAFNNYYSNPLKTLQSAFEARGIADSLNYASGRAEAIREIGLAYWAQGDMSTAITYFLAGLRIAKENRLAQAEADLTSNMGTAYNGLGEHRQALSFLLRAKAMQRALGNRWREGSVTNNIGDVYLVFGNFDSARWAYTLSYDISKEQGYKLGVSTNWRNLGNVMEAEGKYEQAIRNYQDCVDLSTEINDFRGIILSHKSLASVYLKQKNYRLAEQHAREALSLAAAKKLKSYLRDCYQLMARIYDLKGDPVKAYSFFKSYSLYKDSLQDMKVISEVNAQRFRYETESKLNEIAILKKESELQAAEVKMRTSQMGYLLVLLLVVVVALVLYARSHRSIRKTNLLLNEKNQEIEAQRTILAQRKDELTLLNAELVTQREQLSAKNAEIERMNRQIMESHDNLEQTVRERTRQLERQNQQLAEYAHFNAHQLRAPVASILGLASLLQKGATDEEREELARHLRKATESLDVIIKSMNATLEERTGTQ